MTTTPAVPDPTLDKLEAAVRATFGAVAELVLKMADELTSASPTADTDRREFLAKTLAAGPEVFDEFLRSAASAAPRGPTNERS